MHPAQAGAAVHGSLTGTIGTAVVMSRSNQAIAALGRDIAGKGTSAADLLDPEKLQRLRRSARRTGSQLLATIEMYLSETGIAVSAFGTSVMNDAGFVQGLRSGRQAKPETAAKVISYIAGCPRLQAARSASARRQVPGMVEGAVA